MLSDTPPASTGCSPYRSHSASASAAQRSAVHSFSAWVLPMTSEQKPFTVAQAALDQRGGEFSPDGRWLAYESNESGRFEVYVRPFPQAGGKWQASSAGGT